MKEEPEKVVTELGFAPTDLVTADHIPTAQEILGEIVAQRHLHILLVDDDEPFVQDMLRDGGFQLDQPEPLYPECWIDGLPMGEATTNTLSLLEIAPGMPPTATSVASWATSLMVLS